MTSIVLQKRHKDSAGSLVGRMFSAWMGRRQTVDLLNFDDRMLRDIGVTRWDVASALSSPLGEDPSVRLAGLANERRAARGLLLKDARRLND